MTLGPSPRRACATASVAAANIPGKSQPSTWYRFSPPYPFTIPETDSPASWSLTGTEIANLLFCMTKMTGNFPRAAQFTAS